MPELISPFTKRSTPCPACGRMHEHRMFRVRQFVPREVEEDQHVKAYKWMSDLTFPVHPPYYALYFCPFCYYCDFLEDYREPSRSKASFFIFKVFNRFEEEHLRVTDFLGRHVNYKDVNFCMAVTMHYQAIYIQQMAPPDALDAFKTARLALRLAWLFREADGGEEVPEGPSTCRDKPYFRYPNYAAFLADLVKVWPEAPMDEMTATRLACRLFETAVSTDARFDKPAKYYQGVKLLLNILDRCGDLDGAYNTVRGIYMEGIRARTAYQAQISDPETPASVKEQLSGDLRTVNAYMCDAGELRDEFLAKLVQRDLPWVIELVRDNPGISAKELEEIAIAEGVIPEVLHRIQAEAAKRAGR